MPKFVIEREIPGAGKLSEAELKNVSQTSCQVLRELGPQVQWLQSYVTADKIYCVYIRLTKSRYANTPGLEDFLPTVWRE